MAELGVFDVARKNIYWMIAGIIIAMVVLTLGLTLGGYTSKLTKVPAKVQAEIIALRFTHLPDCFALEINGVHNGVQRAGTIELAKFTTERMNACYFTEEEKGFKTFNFRLQLKNAGKEVASNNYFHHDAFTLQKEVLVWDGGEFIPDTLLIHVQEKI